MAEPKTEQEPSIEEILESIRQIISDDTETAPAGPGVDLSQAKPATPPPQTMTFAQEVASVDADDSVIDLTEIVAAERDNGPGPDLSVSAAEEDISAIEIDLREISDTPQDIPEEGSASMAAKPDISADTTVLSENTADAATAAMARLLASNVAVERDEPARVGRVTLEDLTREMLRPMIKTWLDQNLPRVIEKIVAREVEKLARRALDQ